MSTRPSRFQDLEMPRRRRAWSGTRVVVIALVVLNLAYFVWTQGGFAMLGTMPARLKEGDPQRLADQVRPQALRVLKESTTGNAPPAGAASSAAPSSR